MVVFLVIVHVIVSIALIAIVLLQSGKGAEMGASFGTGGSQSVFGAGGGTSFMSKLTTYAAVIFMLTSLTLAYMSGHTGGSSVMSKGVPKPAAPAAPMQGAPMGAPAQGKPMGAPMQAKPAGSPAAAPQAAPQPAAPAAPAQKK